MGFYIRKLHNNLNIWPGDVGIDVLIYSGANFVLVSYKMILYLIPKYIFKMTLHQKVICGIEHYNISNIMRTSINAWCKRK